jgi:hypothetical protein
MYQVVGGLIQINAQLAEMYRMSVEVWNKQSDYWRHNLITAGHTLGFNKTNARSSRLFRTLGLVFPGRVVFRREDVPTTPAMAPSPVATRASACRI